MDWESETTKKHIKEAEAQGCKLLGAGRNAPSRLYSLPCGHEQEIQMTNMRRGMFDCAVCQAERLSHEAEAQGCKLLGAGKKSAYRLYELPCGHEQELPIGSIRKGGFRCAVCVVKKLNEEAAAQGCELLGAGRNSDCRLYKLPCGHEQEVITANMRAGRLRCSVCQAEKLNQEAEAQGCKLLGSGKSPLYRLYELSCGHQQEFQVGAIRKHQFRCSVCQAQKLNQEAEAQGCELVGAGKDFVYLRYKLPCGHEQEIQKSNMRRGVFDCAVCRDEKLNQEAVAQDCRLLGAGKDANHRLYQLPCGHQQEIVTSCMREGEFICRECLAEKLNQEAGARGCKLLGAGKNANYRLYEISCGHQQEFQVDAMRKGQFRCSVCQAEKLNHEAAAQGCKLLGAGKHFSYRLYQLPCGHQQEVQLDAMRKGGFRCAVCLAEKLNEEAAAQGCKLLGAGRNANFRLYEFSCGHQQEVHTGAMRAGIFLCQKCEETSRTLPSNVYLFHIKLDSDEWLKLGYAKEVNFRASQYGLPTGAKVTTVCCLTFDTGNEAHAVEAEFHKRYRRKRLTKRQMMDFHTKGGFNECYPVTMLETLLAEFEALKSLQER